MKTHGATLWLTVWVQIKNKSNWHQVSSSDNTHKWGPSDSNNTFSAELNSLSLKLKPSFPFFVNFNVTLVRFYKHNLFFHLRQNSSHFWKKAAGAANFLFSQNGDYHKVFKTWKTGPTHFRGIWSWDWDWTQVPDTRVLEVWALRYGVPFLQKMLNWPLLMFLVPCFCQGLVLVNMFCSRF